MSERWQQVERLYHAALERGAERRAAFLAEACAGDEGLRREVESLLAYEEQAEAFIESPALEVAAKMMAEEQGATVAAGQTINQYKIISPLGAGGMGEVYLAEDTRLGRRVALKFLPALFTQDKGHLRRFEQEARAVAALSHPNVCTIHEVVETGEGRHCIVMEYVEGVTLRERIAEGRMKVGEALDVAGQVASALSAAHAAGIVHRDIKPENVMLRRDGYVKVLDFGLAKLTEKESEPPDGEGESRSLELKTSPGMVMGTVAYMSPEQARGLPVDARTDVWSLGVVLYEMVAGRQPFDGATPTDVIISIAEREPEPLARCAPEVPIQLERIVKKALAKDREERYQTAEDLLIDLKGLRHELEIEAEVERYKQPTASSGSAATTSDRQVITSRFFPFGLTRSRILILTALVGMLIIAGLVFRAILSPKFGTSTANRNQVARRAAAGEPLRRRFTGLLRRRDDRRADHRLGQGRRATGDFTAIGDAVQGRAQAAAGDRPRVERGCSADRFGGALRRARADRRPTDPRGDGPKFMGRQLRARSARRAGVTERGDARHRRRNQDQADAAGAR